MRSPFRSESSAVRFVVVTLAAFALVVVAWVPGGPWAGLAVWIAVTLAVAAYYALAGRRGRPLATAPPRLGDPAERRVLVLAQEPLSDDPALEELGRRASRVLVVSPLVTSTTQRWASDVDGAHDDARLRLEHSVGRLRAANVDAAGEIGDEDPLQAVEDALRTFGADEIVVSAHGPGAGRTAERLRVRFALPVTRLEA